MLETHTLIIDEYDDRYTSRLFSCISEEKRERIERFHFEKDKQMSLLANILLRTLICRYMKMKNSEIQIETTAYGKPYLANRSGIHFNLSHSGNRQDSEKYVACAISSQKVGIDVECTYNGPGALEELLKYFSPDEQSKIMAYKGMERKKMFTKIWTMKESYTKLLGVGLNLPLNSFSTVSRLGEYRFYQVRENADMVCSVCTKADEITKNVMHYSSDFIPVAVDILC